jgi:hypothetical protein
MYQKRWKEEHGINILLSTLGAFGGQVRNSLSVGLSGIFCISEFIGPNSTTHIRLFEQPVVCCGAIQVLNNLT